MQHLLLIRLLLKGPLGALLGMLPCFGLRLYELLVGGLLCLPSCRSLPPLLQLPVDLGNSNSLSRQNKNQSKKKKIKQKIKHNNIVKLTLTILPMQINVLSPMIFSPRQPRPPAVGHPRPPGPRSHRGAVCRGVHRCCAACAVDPCHSCGPRGPLRRSSRPLRAVL